MIKSFQYTAGDFFSRFGVWHQRRTLSEVLGMRILTKKKKKRIGKYFV